VPLPAGHRGVVECTRGPKPRYKAQATAPRVRLPRVPDTLAYNSTWSV
jgi:hypothetical protein